MADGDVTPGTPTEQVLVGQVVRGDRRGRELGFPTANVEVHEPREHGLADGVYAGWFEDESGRRHVAAISIGTRPTYYGDGALRLVEVHLLDFSGDLYDQVVTVGVSRFLRGQLRFEDSDSLVAQMHRDLEAVRAATKDPS